MEQALEKVLTDNGIKTLPDSKGWKNRFEIHSETSDRVYVIAQRETTGEFGCSCPGWKRHRHCKHLDTIKQLLH